MSQKIKLMLLGVAILVLAAVVWFVVLSPIRADIADTEAAIQDEQDLVMQANTKLAQAEVTRAEGKRNQMRLLELAKMVPMSEEIPSLLLQIQDLADQAGIEFIQVTPGEASATESGDFQLIPLGLEFSGTYFDVSDFIYRAEQMVAGPGRLLAIKSLDLALGGETDAPAVGSPELKVNMTIYGFTMGGGGAAPATVTPPASTTGDTESSTGTPQTDTEQ